MNLFLFESVVCTWVLFPTQCDRTCVIWSNTHHYNSNKCFGCNSYLLTCGISNSIGSLTIDLKTSTSNWYTVKALKWGSSLSSSAIASNVVTVTYRDVGLGLCAVESELHWCIPVEEGKEPLGPEGGNEIFIPETPIEAEHSVEVQSQTTAVVHQHTQLLPLENKQSPR